jgi:hypothetical protein
MHKERAMKADEITGLIRRLDTQRDWALRMHDRHARELYEDAIAALQSLAQARGDAEDARRYQGLRSMRPLTHLFDIVNDVAFLDANFRTRDDIPEQFDRLVDAALSREGENK